MAKKKQPKNIQAIDDFMRKHQIYCMKEIMKWEERIAQFKFSISRDENGRDFYYNDEKHVENAISVIYGQLYKNLNNAYSRYFSMCHLFTEEETSAMIKHISKDYVHSYEKIMRDMGLKEIPKPQSWMFGTRDQFIAEVDRLLTEQNSKIIMDTLSDELDNSDYPEDDDL